MNRQSLLKETCKTMGFLFIGWNTDCSPPLLFASFAVLGIACTSFFVLPFSRILFIIPHFFLFFKSRYNFDPIFILQKFDKIPLFISFHFYQNLFFVLHIHITLYLLQQKHLSSLFFLALVFLLYYQSNSCTSFDTPFASFPITITFFL